MNFLSPFYALAALAVIAPILFHLVRRRPKEKVTFSSLMFLDPTPPRLTRSSRIDHWVLLLLRAAALLLVAAAFSRPYWDSPQAANALQSGMRRVILVDASASMRRDGMWSEAKARASEWIRQSSPGDVVAVYAFHERTEPLVSVSESLDTREGQRQALALQAIDRLQPTWFTAQLGQAIQTALDASQVDSEEDSESPPQRIDLVVISDFQQSMKLDQLTSIAWPAGAQFHPVILSQSVKQASNARAVLIEDDVRSDPELSEAAALIPGANAAVFRARVANGRESEDERFQLVWLDSKSNALADSPTLESTVLRGKSQIVRLNSIPENAVCLELQGDSVPFDNRFYFAPKKRIAKSVIAIEPSRGNASRSEPTESLSFFLQQVPLGNAKYDVSLKRVDSTDEIDDEQWKNTTLVFASAQASVQDLKRLKTFAESGGHVVWVWDQPAVKSAVESAVESAVDLGGIYQQAFGATIGQITEATVKQYSMLERIQFSSYLFRSLSDPKFNDFTKIRIWRHRDVVLSEPEKWQVFASFDNRMPAMFERKLGTGSWTVFAAGWQPIESQLALSSKFVPIMVNRVEASLPAANYANQMRVGESIRIPAASILLNVTSGSTEVAESSSEIEWIAKEPGLYRITGAGETQSEIAVNVAESESEVTQHDIQRMAQTGAPLSEPGDGERSEGQQRQLRAVELESSQSSWRWLLCCVLGLIGLESLWSLRRRTAEG